MVIYYKTMDAKHFYLLVGIYVGDEEEAGGKLDPNYVYLAFDSLIRGLPNPNTASSAACLPGRTHTAVSAQGVVKWVTDRTGFGFVRKEGETARPASKAAKGATGKIMAPIFFFIFLKLGTFTGPAACNKMSQLNHGAV